MEVGILGDHNFIFVIWSCGPIGMG